MGEWLASIARSGTALQMRRLSEPAHVARTGFFCASASNPTFAPHGRALTDFDFWSYRTPAMDAVNLRDVVLTGTDGVALVGSRVVPETVSHIMTWAAGSAVESFRSKAHLRLRQARDISWLPQDRSYFVGFTASWRNYAHWLQECLPKLVAFVGLASDIPGLRLIVPRFPPSSFQQQTLDLLGIKPDAVCSVDHDDCIGLEDGWLMTNTDIWSVPPIVAESAAFLRARVGPRDAPAGERVYIHRSESTRKLVNFEIIRPILQEYGFSVVSFDAMPLSTQIATMRAARLVIGEHGAGLANILFCMPDAWVLELFNPACVQPAFWSVASASDLNFGYIVGDHVEVAGKSHPDWNTPYEISPATLDAAIRLMPGSLKPVQRIGSPVARVQGLADVTFTGPALFEIGEVKFALAGAQDATTKERVLVYKDRGFIDGYLHTFRDVTASRAFEFGNHEAGSSVFFTVLLGLEKFVSVTDAGAKPHVSDVLAHLKLDEKIRLYNEIKQDQADSIRTIIEAEFGGEPLDIILDDASHHYAQTKQSFQIAFPYLRDGGLYIIEDWSWAHWPENQDATHGWNDKPALSNLIIELVLLLPSSDMIEEITVKQGYVVVKKKASRFMASLLNIDDTLRTRGRHLGKI